MTGKEIEHLIIKHNLKIHDVWKGLGITHSRLLRLRARKKLKKYDELAITKFFESFE